MSSTRPRAAEDSARFPVTKGLGVCADGPGQLAAVVVARRREAVVCRFGGTKQSAHLPRQPAGCRAQEDPASLAPPFGETGVAQDGDMPRDARLALPQDLRDLADRELHGRHQPHDAQPGAVGKGAEGKLGLHYRGNI